MPGPTILRPAMSTAPMDTLTLTQQHALLAVRVGDTILVEPESSFTSPYLLLVDTITSASRDSITIASKAKYEISQVNLFDFLRYGSWNLQSMTHDWLNDGHILEDYLSPSDTLTLNPTADMLKMRFLGGACLYQNCAGGLVHKSPVTVNDVHFHETESRAGRAVWTLCPYCMGFDLQQRHECLVTCTIPDRYSESVMQAHRQAINFQRAESGYAPLPYDIDLVVLDGQLGQATGIQNRIPSPSADPDSSRRSSRRYQVPRPVQSRHSSRGTLHWPEGPRLSSHTFQWFQNARERVLNDVCGLCQEEYQEGERIVDLLCQHYYHESCLKMCFEAQRNDRKREACPLCRRRVVS